MPTAKALGVSSYLTYGADCMPHDLAHYLGGDYKGEYLSRYVRRKPAARMALYHSVGASDPSWPPTFVQPHRRWAAGDAAGVDPVQRVAADQDQAGWQRSAWDLTAGDRDRPGHRRNADARVGLRHGFTRSISTSSVPMWVSAGISAAAAGADGGRIRAHSICRATHGAGSEGEPRQCDACGGETAAGGDRRVAHGCREPDAGAGNGIFRRGAEGVQRTEPGAADGSRGAEAQACFSAFRI